MSREPSNPGEQGRLFAARYRPRDAVLPALFGSVFVAVLTGIGGVISVAFLAAGGWWPDRSPSVPPPFWEESGLPGADSGAPLALRVLGLVVPATLGLVWLAVTAAVGSGVLRGILRSLVVAVDRAGVTLGSRWPGRRPQVVPWARIRAVSLYSTLRRDEGRTSATDWLQLDLSDGTVVRRAFDRSRFSWPLLADAVRAASPATVLRADGVIQAGDGPAAA